MKESNTKQMRCAFTAYKNSKTKTLGECYKNCSYRKERAFMYCMDLCTKYNGTDLRIIGYNCSTFSVGFIGYVNNRKAFIYITAWYDRFMYIDWGAKWITININYIIHIIV